MNGLFLDPGVFRSIDVSVLLSPVFSSIFFETILSSMAERTKSYIQ